MQNPYVKNISLMQEKNMEYFEARVEDFEARFEKNNQTKQ